MDWQLLDRDREIFDCELASFVPPPEPAAWPYIATSVGVHLGYYAAVAGAYRAGDLSHGYPIMRGAAPLLVALATWLWIGERLSAQAWSGSERRSRTSGERRVRLAVDRPGDPAVALDTALHAGGRPDVAERRLVVVEGLEHLLAPRNDDPGVVQRLLAEHRLGSERVH